VNLPDILLFVAKTSLIITMVFLVGGLVYTAGLIVRDLWYVAQGPRYRGLVQAKPDSGLGIIRLRAVVIAVIGCVSLALLAVVLYEIGG
jgi:hypothetical protein